MLLPLLLSFFLAQGPLPAFDTGVVTGVVKQADGSPAAKVRVAAMPAESDGDSLVALSETDATGHYRLEAVPAGRYYVVAGRVNAPTFYPGVVQKSEAKTVAVTKGSEVSGIDFTVSKASIQPATPFESALSLSIQNLTTQIPLNGRIVLDETSKGQPLPDRITINVKASGTTNRPTPSVTYSFFETNITTRVSVAADGTFTFSAAEGDDTITVAGLPAGYTLKAITAGNTDLTTQKLSVKQGAPEVVIVVSADLRPRFRVQGKVVAPANIDLFGEAIELVSESGATTRILLGPGGAFAFTNVLPGKYVVKFPSSNLQQSIQVTDSHIDIELRP